MEANDGLVWLTFSGGPGVKAFLSASSLFAEWGLERGSSNSDID
jgi:hypothetical protein